MVRLASLGEVWRWRGFLKSHDFLSYSTAWTPECHGRSFIDICQFYDDVSVPASDR
jgi:hypothetical protein